MADVQRHPPRRKSHYRDPLGALTVASVVYLISLLVALLAVPRIIALSLPVALLQAIVFLALWAPLVIGVYWAGRRYGDGDARTDVGLRIRLIDLGIGLLVGLVLRFGVEAIAPSSPGATLDGTTAALPEVPLLVVIIVGTGLAAPFVEELFFRGLLQRSVSGLVPGRRPARVIVSVLVSTPLFVLLHLATSAPTLWGTVAIVTGISGLVFGLLAALTRRLGPGIVAHVVFNGVGLAILYVR
ncbi:CPBP family intramembrane glutamic endopeptidase [Protaetiibacter intestinalis]|uniref:CPBP family intramembrane metalloprotease n=1 Tax=Protaetiibacter intestinalis TaxID=2419774 RepID=A0A387B811_9MICO|nr:CPBP family intramembrane glutamic endopeptidase [Protaetiibacter intestinalis]AYF97236.1 CPBP family intramembrane metalloprotease [Protaetiibacter intestinalis]